MKKMYLSIVLIFFVLFCLFIYRNNSIQDNAIKVDDVKQDFDFIVSEENPEDIAYRVAYKQGKMAFYNQMSVTGDLSKEEMLALASNINFSTQVISYTSNKDSEKFEEASAKGYADGYHKACDSLYCPR